MDWNVVWLPDAEEELARCWLSSPDRQRLTFAADQIDKQLQRDPEDIGESRAEGRRILIVPPLTVTYRVRLDERVVSVIHVREFHRKEE
jgi:hypothetical protein